MKNKTIKITSIVVLIAIVFAILLSFTNRSKSSDDNLKTVRLNEVVRSVFYAPMYVAINEGFFKDEGLSIDLSTGQGADKTMQQVLSNNADIGFCGPEQTIYINNQGRENYPVVFAKLTQTDGAFLVGREDEANFTWSDLRGKNVIGGRPGGVPEMAFEYVLRANGLDPKEDVNMITNIDFTATAAAFKAGTGDYVTLFEPTASMLNKDASGYILKSVGESAGTIPYTTFFATKSYIDENPEIIQKFTNAIYKAQIWVANHSDQEVAESIASFFDGTDKEIMISVVKNYRAINAIATDPTIKEADLGRLMDIIHSYDASLLPQRPEFTKIIDNSFADKAMSTINQNK